MQRALTIREQTLGLEHPDTAENMQGLAHLRGVQGGKEASRTWYTRALAVREGTLGTRHPKTSETQIKLIAVLYAMGQRGEAARLEAVQAKQ